MKNYSEELLHADLTADQKAKVEAETRYQWTKRFWEGFVYPAITGAPNPSHYGFAEGPSVQTNKDEILAQRKTEHFGQVLPIEDVEKVIDMVDSITRMPCGCRYIHTGLADRRYCFGLGLDKWSILGKYPDAAASLEVLDKAEARKYFRHFDQEGLVHSIWTGVTPYVVGLCNCDRDCLAYDGYIIRRGLPQFFRAEYICQVDWDACTGCKNCMSQCQFGAMFYSSALGKINIDPHRCFGCGVCRAECPNDAIMLIPREAKPEVANEWLEETGG
ncbi:MAG: 4Fe-4S binding protein [Anaerolineales bacterium]|nr:4Fe-4S binding protein [Anaerolineales bacterium]